LNERYMALRSSFVNGANLFDGSKPIHEIAWVQNGLYKLQE